jgi:hypothetical protein
MLGIDKIHALDILSKIMLDIDMNKTSTKIMCLQSNIGRYAILVEYSLY